MTSLPPLAGLRVVEFAGIGPVPHAGMLLADMGAEILRIERGNSAVPDPVSQRGRTAIALDLKSPEGLATARAALAAADVLLEGYRPGTMERLGLGPEDVRSLNPRLIYARMTGWGQDGPMADKAGHDINYIALTGALDEIGYADRPPVPPINCLGDFGGGSLYLVVGVLLALLERVRSGEGQVVDAAIVDGTASLLASHTGMRALIGAGRGVNMLSGALPNYRTYRCADGAHVALGAIEEAFWDELADGLGLCEQDRRRRPEDLPALHRRLEQIFLTAPAAEWVERLAARDCCLVPVLTIEQAAEHPHLAARGTWQHRDGVLHPGPAPRLSRTPGVLAAPAPAYGEGGRETLERWKRAMPGVEPAPMKSSADA